MKTLEILEKARSKWNRADLNMSLNKREYTHQADWIEFESTLVTGTIHLWDTGFMDCLIYLMENGEEVVNSHFELNDSLEVIRVLDELFEKHIV